MDSFIAHTDSRNDGERVEKSTGKTPLLAAFERIHSVVSVFYCTHDLFLVILKLCTNSLFPGPLRKNVELKTNTSKNKNN